MSSVSTQLPAPNDLNLQHIVSQRQSGQSVNFEGSRTLSGLGLEHFGHRDTREFRAVWQKILLCWGGKCVDDYKVVHQPL